MAEKKKITPKQQKAIQAIIEGKSKADAAALAGVAARTIYKWLNSQAFADQLRTAETFALLNSQAALIARIDENIEILDTIKRNGDASDNARIRAIQLELDVMLQWRNVTILEERITELEKRVEAIKP